MLAFARLNIRLVVALVVVALIVIGVILGTVAAIILGSSAEDTSPLAQPCGVTALPASAASGNIQQQQIQNAKTIDQTAKGLGLPGQATRIAIIAAIGESSLINITYGDNATNPDGTVADSLGLFQQQPSQGWGTNAQVLDPAYATTSFLIGKKHDRAGGLVAIAGWEGMQPTIAIHKVQINADPNHYARYYAQADQIIAAAGIDVNRGVTSGAIASPAGAACTIGGDAQTTAKQLVAYVSAGKLSQDANDEGDILSQIRNIADGKSVPNCGVDPRILTVIEIAIQKFGSVTISSLNRRCTGVIAGAGTNSAHYVNGGGHAVDIINLGGVRTDGSDANDIALLQALDPVMSAGSAVGQVQCRPHVDLPHLTQFPDTCSHQHIQVDPWSTTPMNLAGA